MIMKKEVVISLLAGLVLGKAGETIFGSDTARKAYTRAASGAYIAKDAIMEEVEKIQAGAMDIATDARAQADRYQARKDAEYAAGAGTEDEVAERAEGLTDLDTDVVEA